MVCTKCHSPFYSSNCYFCLTNITGITSKSKHTVKYPNLPSAHSEELPAAQPWENLTLSDYNSDFDDDHGQQEGDNVDCDLTFEARCSLSEPHLTQGNLNNPVCDLILSKKIR